MAHRKTLEELQAARVKAEEKLKLRQDNLKKLKQQEAELTRKARTHRLCTHGAMLEQYLDPEEFTDEQIDGILRAIFNSHDTHVILLRVREQIQSQSETQ